MLFWRSTNCPYYIKRIEKVSWTSIDPTYTHFIINDKTTYEKCVKYVEEYRRGFSGCGLFLFEVHDKKSSEKWIKRFDPSSNFGNLPVVHVNRSEDVNKLFCVQGIPKAE